MRAGDCGQSRAARLTARRRHRTFQAGGCPARPVLKISMSKTNAGKVPRSFSSPRCRVAQPDEALLARCIRDAVTRLSVNHRRGAAVKRQSSGAAAGRGRSVAFDRRGVAVDHHGSLSRPMRSTVRRVRPARSPARAGAQLHVGDRAALSGTHARRSDRTTMPNVHTCWVLAGASLRLPAARCDRSASRTIDDPQRRVHPDGAVQKGCDRTSSSRSGRRS